MLPNLFLLYCHLKYKNCFSLRSVRKSNPPEAFFFHLFCFLSQLLFLVKWMIQWRLLRRTWSWILLCMIQPFQNLLKSSFLLSEVIFYTRKMKRCELINENFPFSMLTSLEQIVSSLELVYFEGDRKVEHAAQRSCSFLLWRHSKPFWTLSSATWDLC